MKNTLTLTVENNHGEEQTLELVSKYGASMAKSMGMSFWNVVLKRNKKQLFNQGSYIDNCTGPMWSIISIEIHGDLDNNPTYIVNAEEHKNGKYSYNNWDISHLMVVKSCQYNGIAHRGESCVVEVS